MLVGMPLLQAEKMLPPIMDGEFPRVKNVMVVPTSSFSSFSRFGEVGEKMRGFTIRKPDNLQKKKKFFPSIYRENT
ncbi:hypothetical protein D3C86_1307820 [compost metagenome]